MEQPEGWLEDPATTREKHSEVHAVSIISRTVNDSIISRTVNVRGCMLLVCTHERMHTSANDCIHVHMHAHIYRNHTQTRTRACRHGHTPTDTRNQTCMTSALSIAADCMSPLVSISTITCLASPGVMICPPLATRGGNVRACPHCQRVGALMPSDRKVKFFPYRKGSM